LTNESAHNCSLEINKIKGQLMVKAMKKGIWENFGQKERRKLEDKYAMYVPEIAKLILDFDEWCSTYTIK